MKFKPIEVEGFAELDAQLAAIGTALATEAGEAAVLASAEVLRDAWVAGAPYAEGTRRKYWTLASGAVRSRDYGHLRDNIAIRRVDPQKSHAVVYAVSTGDAFWGYFLEWGTVDMRAHPWARPIVEQLRVQLVQVQVDVLQRKINDAIDGAPKFGRVLANGRNA